MVVDLVEHLESCEPFHWCLLIQFRDHGCPVISACTVNAFKARLDKFWQHQLVKFDFTADLTGNGNRSEEVTK